MPNTNYGDGQLHQAKRKSRTYPTRTSRRQAATSNHSPIHRKANEDTRRKKKTLCHNSPSHAKPQDMPRPDEPNKSNAKVRHASILVCSVDYYSFLCVNITTIVNSENAVPQTSTQYRRFYYVPDKVLGLF